jgi:DNA-binding response OmpR family regulator
MPNALNIMVVEDHDALRDVTVEALTRQGHHVCGVDCAEAVPDEAALRTIDLMVIDLNLPGEDGISLATRIRAAQPNVGIIMVTARNQLPQRLAGYQAGADIYLTKPTSIDELLAAIAALARRIKPQALKADALTLDLATLSLCGPLGSVSLSGHEAALLTALVRAKDQQLESWQLIALGDKAVTEASKKALEVQIVRLRKKLQQAGAPDASIKALRGQGYKLLLKMALRSD